MLDNRVEKLITAIDKLRDFSVTQDDLNAVKDILNLIFRPDANCVGFIYTVNTDKLPFGCVVMPTLRGIDVNDYFVVGNDSCLSEYMVELDSKLFDYGLTNEEVAQVMLFNIYHMVKDFTPLRNVRMAIDDFLTKSATQLIIKDSVQYKEILKLGLVDALVNVSSCLRLPSDVVSDPFLESLGLEDFDKALDKLYKEIPGCENEVSRAPKLNMLEWALRLYCDVEKERIPALHILERAKSLTASTLYITKFNNTINALNRIDTDMVVNEAVQTFFNEAKRKGGLLASLKYSGLRDIENDLDEYQIRAKNAETESEVMYALKQINARLAILDNYIRENPDDPEIDRWVAVKLQYMDIRDTLAKKRLHKRNYGIFVDYDALDKLDDENSDEE